MLIDTILDLAGLDYDAVDRRLSLRPVLPGPWPQTGIKQAFPCGTVSYLLQRPIGGKVHHLELKTQLEHPVDARGGIDLPRPQGAGALAGLLAHARPVVRPAHRPDRMVDDAARRSRRMELDLGLRSSEQAAIARIHAAAMPAFRGPARGLAQERLVPPLRLAFGRRVGDPDSPDPTAEHDPFLQVMPEEPVPDRERRLGWLGLPDELADDPPRAVVRLDHLRVVSAARRHGRPGADQRRQRVWRVRRDRHRDQQWSVAGGSRPS